MWYSLNYLVQGFCPLITQFPDGFRLKNVKMEYIFLATLHVESLRDKKYLKTYFCIYLKEV